MRPGVSVSVEHPNAEGYGIIVRNLLAVIEPYLKKDAQIRP
jgi:hypothetical protein